MDEKERLLNDINDKLENERLRKEGRLPGQSKEEAKQLGGCLGAFGCLFAIVFFGLLIGVRLFGS